MSTLKMKYDKLVLENEAWMDKWRN
jgi:hypothetical protein